MIVEREFWSVRLTAAAEADFQNIIDWTLDHFGAKQAPLEVSQPKISSLKNYKPDGFSVERLMSFLLALGQDVEIRITPRRPCAARGG